MPLPTPKNVDNLLSRSAKGKNTNMSGRTPKGELRSRKRKSAYDASPSPDRMRDISDASHDECVEELEASPRKVTWPSTLEKGASGTGSRHHRQQSPKKSSMRTSPGKAQAGGATGSCRGMHEMGIDGPDDLYHEATEPVVDIVSPHLVEPITATHPIADVDFATASDQVKDELLSRGIRDLVQMLNTFAKDVPQIPKERKRSFFDSLLKDQKNKELVRYLGRLAIGDEQGEAAWVELLTGHDTRKALVLGILGQALKEHVFGSLYFGGSQNMIKGLEQSQRAKADTDGFERTRDRADIVRSQAEIDGDLDAACRKTSQQLWDMLGPLWNVDRNPKITFGILKRLRAIVEHAAKLNHKTREAGDVIYYWPPTFKDEEFVPARMEALNIESMIENSPYTKSVGAHGQVRADLVKGQERRSEAIVRIVCFPGMVAYRQFGGELARRELEADRRHHLHPPETIKANKGKRKANTGEGDPTRAGFRSKVICKSVVFLKWGKQRLLTREAGTSAHIDAVRDGKMQKYEKNFVELYDVFLEKHPNLVPKAASVKA